MKARSTADALSVFDGLDAVDVGFMLGAWKGDGYPTGHPLDGALEAFHWHGKRFETLEDVHPLIFDKTDGSVASVNPSLITPALALLDRFPALKSDRTGRLFQACIPLFSTLRSGARLRLTNYRGKESATMIYDRVPINDVFRKLDDDTVLGVMDQKGAQRPFFFVLRREKPAG